VKRCNAILVGNGTMGRRHRERFESCGVKFVGIADTRSEFDEVANKFALDSINKLSANSDMDFAVVASPATTHYAYAKFFLERRVPVFVEKPLAATAEEAQELVALARRNDVLLFVAQSECYNPIFLNFRKHFMAELNGMQNKALNGANPDERLQVLGSMPVLGDPQNPSGANPGGSKQASSDPRELNGGVHLEFRREHKYSARCRDVGVSLDLLVHDLSLFLTLFKIEDVEVESACRPTHLENVDVPDSARMRLKVARGPYRGIVADFFVNRNSDCDARTITVTFNRTERSPESSYTVSLARYLSDGEIAHVPDSLENEHRFFLKLLAGACASWGARAAQSAADCVKLATAPCV